MQKRIRLLLIHSSLYHTHLVVSDDERILIEENVSHQGENLASRKEDVLEALHTLGMNLTKLTAVVSWSAASSETSKQLSSAISDQLNILSLEIRVNESGQSIAEIIKQALQHVRRS